MVNFKGNILKREAMTSKRIEKGGEKNKNQFKEKNKSIE